MNIILKLYTWCSSSRYKYNITHKAKTIATATGWTMAIIGRKAMHSVSTAFTRAVLLREYSTAAELVVKSPDFKKATFKGMTSHFPCLQKLEGKTNDALNRTLTGMYGENVHGHEVYQYDHPFHFKLGGILPNLEIAYETWGELNEDRSNAILIHTGLSASSHARSSKVS